MKTLCILILTMLTFYFSDTSEKKITSKYNCTKIVKNGGRCTGSVYCSACSNCSRCAHCSNGGTCGVCSSSSSNSSYTTPKPKRKTKTSTYYYEPVQETKVYYENESITIYSETINLREKPSTKSIILEKLSYGDTVVFIEKTGEWSKIKVEETGTIGFVFSKLLNF
ncbi:SH3 domain-containing protein [Flavobacterium sp. 1]|uniref:SH3 domain-containing protein n=1 Tax=Flavobacterium sp. 1 TaxID=2035200 RepID=UPI000C250B85|nr:SH3 domain-containing protein [Flavobacterium sp. 1]PJJ07034.1 SH3 domain-containing protein [Flavobacterium sp. 1]